TLVGAERTLLHVFEPPAVDRGLRVRRGVAATPIAAAAAAMNSRRSRYSALSVTRSFMSRAPPLTLTQVSSNLGRCLACAPLRSPSSSSPAQAPRARAGRALNRPV